MNTKTKHTKAKARHKSYMRKTDPVLHTRKNLIWNGRAIVPESKETVVLFGEAENPLVKESARIITQGGRQVEYKNLAISNYKD